MNTHEQEFVRKQMKEKGGEVLLLDSLIEQANKKSWFRPKHKIVISKKEKPVFNVTFDYNGNTIKQKQPEVHH